MQTNASMSQLNVNDGGGKRAIDISHSLKGGEFSFATGHDESSATRANGSVLCSPKCSTLEVPLGRQFTHLGSKRTRLSHSKIKKSHPFLVTCMQEKWYIQGHLCGRGKTEAYFFPPLDVPPYNLNLSQVKTRQGLKPDIDKQHVLENLRLFGCNDNLYTCLNVYDIHPWETWHIEEKVVHAPGPWLTFEIQWPQDDFNLLAWQLGSPLLDEW